MKKPSHILSFMLSAACALLLWPDAGHGRMHDCDFCHDIHGGATYEPLIPYSTIEVLCMTCHGPGGISSLKADVHESPPDFRITCRECHNPHEGESFDNWCPDNCNSQGTGVNIKMVGDSDLDTSGFTKIDTPSSGIRHVVFESRGGSSAPEALHSFADGDQDGNGYYDGVCETCHTLTSRHCNTASGCNHSHQQGKTCTVSNCHSHTKKFIQ